MVDVGTAIAIVSVLINAVRFGLDLRDRLARRPRCPIDTARDAAADCVVEHQHPVRTRSLRDHALGLTIQQLADEEWALVPESQTGGHQCQRCFPDAPLLATIPTPRE